jgi:hypothetical protein
MALAVGVKVRFRDPLYAKYRFVDPDAWAEGVVTALLDEGFVRARFGEREIVSPASHFAVVLPPVETRTLAIRVRTATGARMYDCMLAVEQTSPMLNPEDRILQAVEHLRRTMRTK